MMIERSLIPEAEASAGGQENGSPGGAEGAASPTQLAERISRLEDAVAALQDTRQLEEQIVKRVSGRVQRQQPGKRAPEEAAALGRKPNFSGAAGAFPASGSSDDSPGFSSTAALARRPWLIVEAYADLLAIIRMYCDRRYRVGWLAVVLPIVALTFMWCSWFFLDGKLMFFGTLFDKLIDVLLLFVVYKALVREAERYREHQQTKPESHS